MVFGHGSVGRTIPANLAKEPSAPHVGSGQPDINESDGLHNCIVQDSEKVSAGGSATAPASERDLKSVAVPSYLLHRELRELKHPEGTRDPQCEERTIPSAFKRILRHALEDSLENFRGRLQRATSTVTRRHPNRRPSDDVRRSVHKEWG
jgi:hypothetical protein